MCFSLAVFVYIHWLPWESGVLVLLFVATLTSVRYLIYPHCSSNLFPFCALGYILRVENLSGACELYHIWGVYFLVTLPMEPRGPLDREKEEREECP